MARGSHHPQGGADRTLTLSLDNEGIKSTYVLTGRDALIDLTDEDHQLDRALKERLITLKIDPRRRYGVFDRRSSAYRGIAQRSASLATAASLAYGTAMPAFLTALVRARTQDELALRQKIEMLMRRYERKTRPDTDNIVATEVAVAFAVLYAAGRLAQDWGVLPKNWRCGTLMERAYRVYQASEPARRTFDAELLDLEDAPGTLKIDRQGEPPSAKRIETANVFVLINGRNRHLAIRQTAINDVVRDWSRRRTKSEVQERMIKDAGHSTAKRSLVKGGDSERMFCFRLVQRRK